MKIGPTFQPSIFMRFLSVPKKLPVDLSRFLVLRYHAIFGYTILNSPLNMEITNTPFWIYQENTEMKAYNWRGPMWLHGSFIKIMRSHPTSSLTRHSAISCCSSCSSIDFKGVVEQAHWNKKRGPTGITCGKKRTIRFHCDPITICHYLLYHRIITVYFHGYSMGSHQCPCIFW